ncbi:hypothetical protein [Roseomonas sp. CECT 9278]|uniref:hypothetical protein n=1 Tax=Roseomonas sp. CECT 9278 TaxID=2845823 RepID=UPI001E2A104B|nr:hypothetical protein [Roseomonas sp. CECT 9278]CAH0233946.1 hypothetical protein ROS9278_02721 [Roseomonas sp. CECT 9278]
MKPLIIAALGLAAIATAPPVQAQGAAAFDGTWGGTGRLTQNRGTGTACGPETMDRRFTIQGGRIAFPYDPRTGIDFNGPIGADGRFEIVNGPNRFSGQATGSTMTATFSGRVCERQFQFRRRAGAG